MLSATLYRSFLCWCFQNRKVGEDFQTWLPEAIYLLIREAYLSNLIFRCKPPIKSLPETSQNLLQWPIFSKSITSPKNEARGQFKTNGQIVNSNTEGCTSGFVCLNSEIRKVRFHKCWACTLKNVNHYLSALRTKKTHWSKTSSCLL